MSTSTTQELAKSLKCCILIPTYNNERTLLEVIKDAHAFVPDVIVVNDGATDTTAAILAGQSNLAVVSYQPNRGKGYALKKGFDYARRLGFRYAITMDSDGQHKGSDICRFLQFIHDNPDQLVVGVRSLEQTNIKASSAFANNFSNFWFRLQTAQRLPDTQSGFRLYPLIPLGGLHLLTNRYEAELEILVRANWRGIPIAQVPISVYYPPHNERVSHFRPFKDFFRISILNTVLTILAFIYAYPKKMVCSILPIKKAKSNSGDE